MVDTRFYRLIITDSFKTKTDAYAVIQKFYKHVSFIKTYFDNESQLWFIVQEKNQPYTRNSQFSIIQLNNEGLKEVTKVTSFFIGFN